MARDGRGRRRRRRTAAPVSDSGWSSCSGELSAGEGNGAARTAPQGPREGAEMVERLRS
jgi:hypothetical protein